MIGNATTTLSAANSARGALCKVDNSHRGSLDYDILIRAEGSTDWVFGVTVFNADLAMRFVNIIRLSWPVSVKVLPRPKRNPYASLQ